MTHFANRWLTNEVNYDKSFELEYRGAVPMKGKPEPMQCWYLTRGTGSNFPPITPTAEEVAA